MMRVLWGVAGNYVLVGLRFDFVLGDAALVCLGCVSGFGFAGIGLRLWFYR